MADQANFPDIYIDESVATGGVGSEADPYSDFSEINWSATGDNSVTDYYAGTETASVTINLQRGQTWRERFNIGASGSATYPIIIRPYGSGALPKVLGSVVVSSWSAYTGKVTNHVYKDDANLEALWLMEEASNATRLDETDNDNDLANNGSVAQSATKQEGTYSADFVAGDSDYLSMARDSCTFNNKEDFSIVFWWRCQLIDAWQRIFNYSQGGLHGFDIAFATDETLRFDIGDGTNSLDNQTCSGVLSINTWYHVALTLDGSSGDVIVYIDGSKWGSTFTSSVSKMYNQTGGDFYIGANGGSSQYLTGLIDEVGIFDRALTALEVASIKNNGIEAAPSVSSGTYVKENISPTHSQILGMVTVDASTILLYDADKDALEEGEYHYNTTDDDLYIRLSGEANPSGSTIEVDNEGPCIQASGKDYLTIQYLYIGGGIYGVQLVDGNDYNIVEYCTIRYTANKSIKLQGDNTILTNCTIRHNDLRYAGGTGYSGDSSSFAIHLSGVEGNGGDECTGNVFEYNIIQDTAQGAFMFRDANENIVRYNECHGTKASDFWLHRADSNEIYYNIFDHDGSNDNDYLFYTVDASLNNEIYNNVLISNGNDIGLYVNATSTGTKFKNNIYYGSARCIYVADGGETDFVSDYNCLYVTGGTFANWLGVNKTTFANWKDDSSQDANSIDDDPSFTDASGDDFTLQVGSPCINAGVDVSLTTDYAGNIVGALPDIGAYELIGAIALIPPMMGGDYFLALG